MKINLYRVHFNNGNILDISASNMSGAKAQVESFSKYIARIERVYKTGNRAVAPW